MFVPSAPSCSGSPSSPRVPNLSAVRILSLTFLPNSFPPPSTFHLPIKSFQTHLSRCHFRLLAFMFHLVPSCPYYCRSPAKMNRGFSVTRESLSHSINHPLRHCARSIVISPSVCHGCPLYILRSFTDSPQTVSCANKRLRSYLGFLIWVSTLRHDIQRRCVTGTYFFLTLQAVANSFRHTYVLLE